MSEKKKKQANTPIANSLSPKLDGSGVFRKQLQSPKRVNANSKKGSPVNTDDWQWYHDADVFREEGDWDAAEEIYVAVGEQTHLGRMASSAINSLAFTILIPQRRFVEARAWLQDSMDLEAPWEAWNSLENLAECEYAAGNNEIAERYLRQLIDADDGPVEGSAKFLQKIQAREFAKPVTSHNLEYSEDWRNVDVSIPLQPRSTQRDFYLRLIKDMHDTHKHFDDKKFMKSAGACVTRFVNEVLTEDLLNQGFTREAAAKACLDYIKYVQLGQDPDEDPYTTGLELWNARQGERALSKLRLAARGGNVDAMLLVAKGVEEGFGQDRGLPWYRLAAANGNFEAEQYLLNLEQSGWDDDDDDYDDDEDDDEIDDSYRDVRHVAGTKEGLRGPSGFKGKIQNMLLSLKERVLAFADHLPSEETQEKRVEADPFAVTCIFPNHIEVGFVPESNQFFSLCNECGYPLIPQILMDVLSSGEMPLREPVRSEAATSLFAAVMIYWAQYNLEVKKFHVRGQGTENIEPHPLAPSPGADGSQQELSKVLASLSSYGNEDFGSFEDEPYRTLLGFASDFLHWDVVHHEESGLQEMVLGAKQAFALLNEKNFEALNTYVDSVQSIYSQIMPLCSFFRNALSESQLAERAYLPVHVSAKFKLRAEVDTDGKELSDEYDQTLIDDNPSSYLFPRLRETNQPSRETQAIAVLDSKFRATLTVEDINEFDELPILYECRFEFSAVVSSPGGLSAAGIEAPEALGNFLLTIESEWFHVFTGKPVVSLDDLGFCDEETFEFASGNRFDEIIVNSSEGQIEERSRPVFEIEVSQLDEDSEWFRGSIWAR